MIRNAHTFPIKWPIDGKEIEIRIELKYYTRLLFYHPNDFSNFHTAYEVLNNPNRIFIDLKRRFSNSKNKLCVAGKTRYWRKYVVKDNTSISVLFPPHLVYLVFLDEENYIIEHGAERADMIDSLSPRNCETRFGELLWKKTSQNN
ncbi:MAG: hypothetical protein JYX80_08415 [Candidatus Scalindua sediminis]|nr:hypothetical protein [Candidatus Scalindua sediminis]